MTREEELKKQQRDSLAKEIFVMLVAVQEDEPADALARKAFSAADTFWKVANEMPTAPTEPKKMTGAG